MGVHEMGLCGGQKAAYRELSLSCPVGPEDQAQAVRLGAGSLTT